MGMVYLILMLGAVTTLYPFLLMISTAIKGPTDQNNASLMPRYLNEMEAKKPTGETDDETLLGKYLDDKYSGNKSLIASTRGGGEQLIGKPKSVFVVNDMPILFPGTFDVSYEEFLMDLPLNMWHAGFRTAPNQSTGRLTARYQSWLRARFATIDDLNKAYIEENAAFQTCAPPSEVWDRKGWGPMKGRKWDEWLIFKATLPAEFRLPIRTTRMYQEAVRARCSAQFDQVPVEIRGKAKTFEELEILPESQWYKDFFRDKMPDHLKADNAEKRWPGKLPIAAYENRWVGQQASPIRKEFAGRNFRYVLDYILINGRAVINTIIFCGLAILMQLTVNPIAAYALSRYPIRASGKILLFLLATMAFPAEVAMIPSFLLLKDLGLLNTFAALVLPGAASGYMIFLLKGFFDSLPAELFEAAQIDGAKETTMMMRIAFPLSKPVLGYLALLAFMGAYGAFLFAFLVCQDRSHWTLMVFLYQLQLSAPKATVMAGLALAALPTLVVFLFAQKVIMRGIVLPGER